MPMTDEEKIRAVEEALDGHNELIAEARREFRQFHSYRWDQFSYGFYVAMHEFNAFEYWYNQLIKLLGVARADEINSQEQTKFADEMSADGCDPEVLDVFLYGTDEERRSFPRRELLNRNAEYDDAAEAEWVADRKHAKFRQEYARKFYGVKP